MTHRLKLVVFAPLSHAEKARKALGRAGAGAIGKYSHCSFSSRGTGRFRPGKGAKPAVGKIDKLSAVAEERIEVAVGRKNLPAVLRAMKLAHPYEEVAFDLCPLENPPSF